ncbi:hypothetical protein H112_08323 [Trichophyton rubrum D6]|uniref:Uncharacterized protein n=1 Tax=Trichophyton rubrum CBS 288.86 TaxID=1215330 RepID=A0A022VQF0_TRIRU|nr:hypothetical protein H100_08345 [Trichophyton rubrum MR850]EZF37362.1 hypothetical protein H102_08305 [Trichophyton rubrum CBS 100081]EZF47988.1 hypothetical protein H103_08328 [Trichophyton rubrum CBS 288.86]EZF58608.1 hypothetical protein H104_08278 [Trichophyton rubrum CBS 289.86]EZF79880.1 hypothetical protein H110_08328 [Trichophyton rubrum MR1448]EZG01557.1 hypothetical protein H106_08201 [Trichophyton rubrum CBS 735.88]EZG12109.1 hypothetical protein H107_08476 [Trichophyton rubrum 
MVFVSLGVTLLSDSGIIALPTATEKAAHMVVENSVQGDGRTISFITTTLWRPFHNSTCISTRVREDSDREQRSENDWLKHDVPEELNSTTTIYLVTSYRLHETRSVHLIQSGNDLTIVCVHTKNKELGKAIFDILWLGLVQHHGGTAHAKKPLAASRNGQERESHSELGLEQPRRSELGEALLVVSQLSRTRVGIRAANEIGPGRMITVRVAANLGVSNE